MCLGAWCVLCALCALYVYMTCEMGVLVLEWMLMVYVMVVIGDRPS